MARLESVRKMGYYPTPFKTLAEIKKWVKIEGVGQCHCLDPCCGEGTALNSVASWSAKTYGIELDVERAVRAANILHFIAQGSLFEARINPLGCMGLLYLNPPYDSEDGERLEMKFLKHSIKWLAPSGVLVFIVPEHILQTGGAWISQHFQNIQVYRVHKEDYPIFKQVVLLGIKRPERVEEGEAIAPPPYPYIEDVAMAKPYSPPKTDGPKVFQCGTSVTEQDIASHHEVVWARLNELMDKKKLINRVPLFPLRKGHLVALLTAGVLDGKIDIPGGYLVVKGYSSRTQTTREEGEKEIITDTYAVGVRVIEVNGKVDWYDIT